VGFLRTVLGDIPASGAGICYAHEHIIIERGFTTSQYPDFLIDSVEKAVTEVGEFRAAGGNTLVDSMPCGCGRNVVKLAEVSRRTGVNILCPTGLHLAKYYAPGHWTGRLSADDLTRLFVAEIEEGIHEADDHGRTVTRTAYRAGTIKIASGADRLSATEAKIFEAAAAAHRLSGAPILTHTEQGAGGLQQIEFLAARGVDLSRVILSHTDRKPCVSYHRELLSSGVMLEYDSAFRWTAERGNPTEDLIVEMFTAGYGGQILLGMDAARRTYWRSYGGTPGLTYLLNQFVPRLKSRGLSQGNIESIFVQNPARCYAFPASLQM
jgi:predicted metal-dependent phosphotriesterase family hydrolase